MSGAIVWFTGLPRSGKTTLAHAAHAALARCGCTSVVLDGDEVRKALRPSPGYDATSRDDFYETLANLAALLAAQGVVVLVAATAHLRRFRERARDLSPRFLEVHVATPLEDCAGRETHGLYFSSEARPLLPGVGVPYETPWSPDVLARGGHDPLAVEHLVSLLAPLH
jgi:adenylylsulfate kinase